MASSIIASETPTSALRQIKNKEHKRKREIVLRKSLTAPLHHEVS